MAKRKWQQNIQRIDHIVMVAEPENVESAAKTYAKLFDIEWEGPFDAEEVGLRCYVCWDAGLELVAPFDKSKMPDMAAFLATHGEGIYRVVFGVSDREAALARAESMGLEVLFRSDALKSNPIWKDRFARIDLSGITPVHGVRISFGQIEPIPDPESGEKGSL